MILMISYICVCVSTIFCLLEHFLAISFDFFFQLRVFVVVVVIVRLAHWHNFIDFHCVLALLHRVLSPNISEQEFEQKGKTLCILLLFQNIDHSYQLISNCRNVNLFQLPTPFKTSYVMMCLHNSSCANEWLNWGAALYMFCLLGFYYCYFLKFLGKWFFF